MSLTTSYIPFHSGKQLKESTLPVELILALGVFKNGAAFRKGLRQGRRKVSDLAAKLIERPEFTCAREKTTLKVVACSVKDVCRGSSSFGRFCSSAIAQGYQLCPAEVGPALMWSLRPKGLPTRLHVAMTAIPNLLGQPRIFKMDCVDKGTGLFCADGRSEVIYEGEDLFLFIPPSR